MRVFEIVEQAHHGRHIHVTKYVATAGGVKINITHDVPNVPGKDLQWVQTYSSNHSFQEVCKQLTMVDPFGSGDPTVHKVPLPSMPGVCLADDLLPFYWTVADLAGGAGPGFSDVPNEPTPAKGRAWLNFVTALTEVSGTTVHHLVAITWGFDRMADGSVRVNGIHRATQAQMKVHGQALKLMYPAYHYT